ncbi:hypothetical protein [Ulvibacterium sp.]|uniref:hypothetical protein n=1 Tax=Ulvibacterium sp. TaxID=2665914 RepID=UPI003BAD8837
MTLLFLNGMNSFGHRKSKYRKPQKTKGNRKYPRNISRYPIYPDRDSGERDADVYINIAQNNPNRYSHDLSSKHTQQKMNAKG